MNNRMVFPVGRWEVNQDNEVFDSTHVAPKVYRMKSHGEAVWLSRDLNSLEYEIAQLKKIIFDSSLTYNPAAWPQ